MCCGCRTGRNAVSHATSSDQLETVRLLLELGAAVPEATIEAHEAQGSFWLPALVKEAQVNSTLTLTLKADFMTMVCNAEKPGGRGSQPRLSSATRNVATYHLTTLALHLYV